jgi:hypothetical protein
MIKLIKMENDIRVVQKLQFLNNNRLKMAKCGAFCRTCSRTNRVLEQVYYLKPLRAMGHEDSRHDRPSMYYPLASPEGSEIYPKRQDGSDGRWRWGPERIIEDAYLIEWVKGRNGWIPFTLLSDEVGNKRTLLVMCTAFRSRSGGFPNLTIKKIPNTVLAKCEWGHDDYSLQIENLPMAEKPQKKQPLLFDGEAE